MSAAWALAISGLVFLGAALLSLACIELTDTPRRPAVIAAVMAALTRLARLIAPWLAVLR